MEITGSEEEVAVAEAANRVGEVGVHPLCVLLQWVPERLRLKRKRNLQATYLRRRRFQSPGGS